MSRPTLPLRRVFRTWSTSLAVVVAVAGCGVTELEPAHDTTADDPMATAHDTAGDSPDMSAHDMVSTDDELFENDDAHDARYPEDAGRFAPALVTVNGEPDIETLADVETCEACHTDVAAHYRMSAHANASMGVNPWFRGTLEAYRDDVGFRASRFCASCHDPLLLFSGKIDREVSPDDPLAHAGVTCLICHSIERTSSEGNASWTLDTSPVPLPIRDDPESVRAHVARVALDPLRKAAMCGACHRGFLNEQTGNAHFVAGLDDLGPWRASAYAGSLATLVDDELEERTCQGCHMRSVDAVRDDAAATDGRITSHRFPGSQTNLSFQGGDPEQQAALADMLHRAATIDVAAIRLANGSWALPADGANVRSGQTFEADVVVRNVGAGHRFPGGVRDTQDAWIELVVRDAHGDVVAEAGTEHDRVADETAHRLITVMLNDDGERELRHFVNEFEARGWDHTVAPRDAAVTRYRVALPTLARDAFPLRVEARLRYRRHTRELVDVACRASRSSRGRAFRAAAAALGHTAFDACVRQPIDDIASAAVWVGAGADERASEGDAKRPAWRRLFEHGLGLTHEVQEHMDDARPTLARALVLAGREDDARAAAMVLGALARVEARQGRLEEALARVAEAEALIGEHPALARARGDAYGQVWQWPEAQRAYERVTELAPADSQAWRDLARAAGSARDDATALRAAREGLALLPRDEGLLRSQALALEAFDEPDAPRARETFLAHRRPDMESELRLTCARASRLCNRDQQPVVTIDLRTRPR